MSLRKFNPLRNNRKYILHSNKSRVDLYQIGLTILFAFTFFFPSIQSLASSDSWTIESEYIDSKQTRRSRLTFTFGDKRFIYQPEDEALGLVSSRQILEGDNKVIFITTWANGGRTMFRVFIFPKALTGSKEDPDTTKSSSSAKISPKCELSSFSDITHYRRTRDGEIQLQIAPHLKSVQLVWETCTQIEVE